MSPPDSSFPVSRVIRIARTFDSWTFIERESCETSYSANVSSSLTETPINEPDEIIDQSHGNMHNQSRAHVDRVIVTRDLVLRFCFHLWQLYLASDCSSSHLRQCGPAAQNWRTPRHWWMKLQLRRYNDIIDDSDAVPRSGFLQQTPISWSICGSD